MDYIFAVWFNHAHHLGTSVSSLYGAPDNYIIFIEVGIPTVLPSRSAEGFTVIPKCSSQSFLWELRYTGLNLSMAIRTYEDTLIGFLLHFLP